MATQLFQWLYLHHNIKTQYSILLGRINNCNSVIQKLSTGWGRTLYLCTAGESNGTPKHPLCAPWTSESSPVPSASCYHWCITARHEQALYWLHLCLSLLIPGLDYLHQYCMKLVRNHWGVQNIKTSQQCIKTNDCITKSSSETLKTQNPLISLGFRTFKS